MFGSNVAPKRRIREQRKFENFCHACSKYFPRYWVKCPNCGRVFKD